MPMKVEVERGRCSGCGRCAETCPMVFSMAAGHAADVRMDTVPLRVESQCRKAAQACPTGAISMVVWYRFAEVEPAWQPAALCVNS